VGTCNLANSQTECQAGHESSPWLEIRGQKVDKPTPERSDSRRTSNTVLRPIEQVLEPACGTRPVDPDDRNRSEILVVEEGRQKKDVDS
jgi:hypothetical protein